MRELHDSLFSRFDVARFDQLAAELGLEAELEYITDMDRVMSYGAMSLPALVVDGKVVSAGMVLTPAEVADYLR